MALRWPIHSYITTPGTASNEETSRGATFTDIQDWAQLVNLQLPSKSQYHAIQSKYLIPAVNDAYKAQQDNNIEHVRELSASGQKVDLGGDARCDSPAPNSPHTPSRMMQLKQFSILS
ncbi:unnamed protein product [Arctogadus glacialis]